MLLKCYKSDFRLYVSLSQLSNADGVQLLHVAGILYKLKRLYKNNVPNIFHVKRFNVWFCAFLVVPRSLKTGP